MGGPGAEPGGVYLSCMGWRNMGRGARHGQWSRRDLRRSGGDILHRSPEPTSSNGVRMRSLSLAVTLAVAPAALLAQQSPARAGTTPPLTVGAVAPDFTMPGATRYGLLASPVHLS